MLTAMCFCAALVSAQNASLRGVVLSEENNAPVVDAVVTLENQNISTTTNTNGEFQLMFLEPMDEELVITSSQFLAKAIAVTIKDGSNDLGQIKVQPDVQTDAKSDVVLQLSDEELEDEEGRNQNMVSTSTARDVYANYVAFTFSSARFRVRGYDNASSQTYINGVNFNGLERGMFNFSSIGGLNRISRQRDDVRPLEASAYAFGDLGASSNILMNATRIAQGWNVGIAAANRNYKGRLTATYGSGLLANGWAFAASLAWRYSPYIDKKGIIGEGSNYNSIGYFFSAEKRFNENHSMNILTFGAPTMRGQNLAVTQEVYDLTGSIYYNPAWGYQDGKMRNSRIVKSFDPTLIANYEWKTEQHNVKVGVGLHYSLYSNSAFNYYNASDPRPDYYRNLPSILFDTQLDANGAFITKDLNGVDLYTAPGANGGGDQYWTYNGNTFGPTVDFNTYQAMTDLWTGRNNATTQVNWDELYAANRSALAANADGQARYILERRHNDLMEITGNATYRGQVLPNMKLTAGLEVKAGRGMHYKTIDDMLGGLQWYDLDPFSERDLKELSGNVEMSQIELDYIKINDLRSFDFEKNRADRVVDGDKKKHFGYDYDINMHKVSAFIQNEWKFNNVDFFYALQATFSGFRRVGNMDNGRARYMSLVYASEMVEVYNRAGMQTDYDWWYDYYSNGSYKSYGKGKYHAFLDPALKLGVSYRIDGHNRLIANFIGETKAPLARTAYVSVRNYDRAVDGLKSAKILGADLTYEINYAAVRGRITGYVTKTWGETQQSGYYDDSYNTFVNYAMTGLDNINAGLEFALAVKAGKYITLTPVVSYRYHQYTSDAKTTYSSENGMVLDYMKLQQGSKDIYVPLYEISDNVYTKGLKVASGPQLAASLKVSFFHPKMWFADISLSYFDHNYMSFAPSHRIQGLFTGMHADGSQSDVQYTIRKEQIVDENGQTQTVNATDDFGHEIAEFPYSVLAKQERLDADKWYHRLMVDMSIGKLIYLKNRQSLSINLSISNLCNNTHFKTGGYQQGRIPTQSLQGQYNGTGANRKQQKQISPNAWKYPAKYYYAWGTNFFLNISYKF